MLCSNFLLRMIFIILMTGVMAQKAYAAEETMLKSRFQQPDSTQSQLENSLFNQLPDSSVIYDYLLDSYDFLKLQGIAIKLWDRHTNIRKYRYTMKDDFIGQPAAAPGNKLSLPQNNK